MKVKESLLTKVIKRFYGISGVLDEYKLRQVEHIGNNAFMLMFWYMILSNFVAALFSYKYPQVTVWALLGTNLFFLVYVISTYIMYATSKLKLTENEVEAKDVAKEKRKNILKGIGAGVQYTVLMHLQLALLGTMFGEGSFIEEIMDTKAIIINIMIGMGFGAIMYLILKNRLKKIDET